MSYRLSPAAQRDVASIWEYTDRMWGVAQAESYARDLQAAIDRIAEEPGRGRPCDEVRSGYRRYEIGRHIVFYRQRAGGVDVIRILHQRMDVSRHL